MGGYLKSSKSLTTMAIWGSPILRNPRCHHQQQQHMIICSVVLIVVTTGWNRCWDKKNGGYLEHYLNTMCIWRFVKMSVPGFVDKSQFHACRPMFALKNMTYLDDVKTWKFFVTFGNLKPQESANARRFSFAVAGTISWTVCLCVCASLNAICFLTCLLINAVSLL